MAPKSVSASGSWNLNATFPNMLSVEYEETTQSPGSMSRSKIKFHSPLADGSNATSN